MSATTRFLCCSVSLLIVLTQLVSVDAIAELPTARIVRRVAEALSNREIVRQKRQSSQCIDLMNKLDSNPTHKICAGIIECYMNSTYTPSQADEFCDNHCPQLLTDNYFKVLNVCGPSYVPDRKIFDMFKEPIYQSCNKSHGEYCLREWVDPATIPDWDNIDQCVSSYKNSKNCPAPCQLALPLINRVLGCCYRVLGDMDDPSHGGDGSFIPVKLFAICGLPTPQLCHD